MRKKASSQEPMNTIVCLIKKSQIWDNPEKQELLESAYGTVGRTVVRGVNPHKRTGLLF